MPHFAVSDGFELFLQLLAVIGAAIGLEHAAGFVAGRHLAIEFLKYRLGGIAKALVAAVERKASELGRWLVVLDTVPGQPAERLYERLGYRRAGVVPDYAEKSGGGFEPTVIFYKKLI